MEFEDILRDERLNHRKHVESRVIEPKQITGERNEDKRNDKVRFTGYKRT